MELDQSTEDRKPRKSVQVPSFCIELIRLEFGR